MICFHQHLLTPNEFKALIILGTQDKIVFTHEVVTDLLSTVRNKIHDWSIEMLSDTHREITKDSIEELQAIPCSFYYLQSIMKYY